MEALCDIKLALDDCLRRLEASDAIEAYAYQARVAEHLFCGHNVLLRVPTGCGKTWAAAIPFLLPELWSSPPHRLIYVLPVRTLIEGVGSILRARLPRIDGWTADHVKIQTGVTQEDAFFSEGRIIVTTFDQILSGMLGNPYSLGPSLHNVNSAALEGCLVVFDEFHLMPPDRAFLTAAAGCELFGGLCQSLWMTATATEPLAELLIRRLNAQEVQLDPEDRERITALAARKSVVLHEEQLRAEDILLRPGRRLVVVNQVARAQELYRAVASRRLRNVPVVALHSRFFRSDRDDHQREVLELLKRDSKVQDAIVIATQVVEAGLDISADCLLTELAPANSIVQRAGRCARYGGSGEVHLFPLPEENGAWLPYGTPSKPDASLQETWHALAELHQLTFDGAVQLVNQVHRSADAAAVSEGVDARRREVCRVVVSNNFQKAREGVNRLIRDTDLSVRLIVEESKDFAPWERDAIRLDFYVLQSFARKLPGCGLNVWTYDEGGTGFWKEVGPGGLPVGFHFLVPPGLASYSTEYGLILGEAGKEVSPAEIAPERPGYAPAGREFWADHGARVARWARDRLLDECGRAGRSTLLSRGLKQKCGIDFEQMEEAAGFTGRAHDLGKLQARWQSWARAAESAACPGYQPERPLAHTSQAAGSPNTRPKHALQGAYLACEMLNACPSDWPPDLALAVVMAIAAHHGGWVYPNARIEPLCDDAAREAGAALGKAFPTLDLNRFAEFVRTLDRHGKSADLVSKRWPLTSLLIRILRLSDQRATAEGSSSD